MAGWRFARVGAGTTVHSVALIAVPAKVCTASGPVVAVGGTPEQIAKVKASHTGRFLAPVLTPAKKRKAA